MAKNKLIESAVAARNDFDGNGYSYLDNGSGSDWRVRAVAAEAELLYPEEIVDEAITLMQEFCNRVDAGEIRSRKTYAKFKIFIANVEVGNHIEPKMHFGARGGGKAVSSEELASKYSAEALAARPCKSGECYAGYTCNNCLGVQK